MTRIEIRSAEGGNDAKLFVGDLVNMYTRYLGRVDERFRVVCCDLRNGKADIECGTRTYS